MTGFAISHDHYRRYQFARQFCANKQVVTISDGTGYGATLLADVARHVTSFVPSAEAASYANAVYGRPNLTFAQGDATTFAQRLTAPTDVIVRIERAETAATQAQIIATLKEQLQPSGILIVTGASPIAGNALTWSNSALTGAAVDQTDLLSLVTRHFAHCYLIEHPQADDEVTEPSENSASTERFSADHEGAAESFADPNLVGMSQFTHEVIAVCSDDALGNLPSSWGGSMETADLTHTPLDGQRSQIATKRHEDDDADQSAQRRLFGEIDALTNTAASLAETAYALRSERDDAYALYHDLNSKVNTGTPARYAFLEYEYNRATSRLMRWIIRTAQRVPLLMPLLLFILRKLIKPIARLALRMVRGARRAQAQAPGQGAATDKRQLATERMYARFEETDGDFAGGYGSWCTDQNPKVSIVILNWNKADLTIRCLKEVWKYTRGHTYEVVVVDNGSTPADYAKLLHFKGNFRLIRLSRNRFFGDGNNIGAEATKGDYLVFLNNDAFVTPGWLEPLIAEFSAHDRVGAVGPMFLYPDGVLQEAGIMVNPDGSVLMRGREQFPIPEEFRQTAEVDYCSAAALVMRRDVFFAIHGFDLLWEPAYYEDVDLCLRAKQLGWHVYYCPDAQVVHVEHATSTDTKSHGIDFSRVVGINKVKFLQRWGPFLSDAGFDTPASLRALLTERARIDEQERRDAIAAAYLDAENPTVGIYTPYDLVPGGGERYLLTIAEQLSKQRRVALILDERYSQMRLATLGHELGLDLSRLRIVSLTAAQREVPFDLFIAMGNEVVPSVPAMGKRNLFICQFPFPQTADVIVSRLPNIQGYDGVIVYSEFVKRHYSRIAATYKLDPLPITVLAPPSFSEQDDHVTLQEKLKLLEQQSTIRIISIGRFFPGGHCKRHDIMIDAFKEAQRILGRSRKIELHLAGTLPASRDCLEYYADLVERARGLNVIFHPNVGVDEMAQLLKTSTFYWHATGFGADEAVYPETMEHFGISVVEAMWNGCVPLVVDKGGPADTVVNGVSGQHYQTVQQLALKTVELIRYPDRLNAMRIEAYKRAEMFSKERFLDQLDTALKATELTLIR